jgi:UV DNA damage endonuclease
MLARLGFVASVLSEHVSTRRTCRLKNATPVRLRELIATNLDALARVTNLLERRRILLYRISSNVIPFASHPINELKWWDEFAHELVDVGRRLRRQEFCTSRSPA